MTRRKSAESQQIRPARSSDIPEHMRTEALQASEATYRAIFNATNDGILVLDVETGEIVDANATFCNVFGYTPEEVRRLRLQDVSSGEAPHVQEDALRLIHQAAGGQPQRFEWLAKSRDGALLWIDVTLKRATIAGRDRVLAVGRDITERKRTEEALRKSEERYRLLAENATDVIWTTDLDLNFTYLSPSARVLRGTTPEHAIAQRVEEILTPASLEIAAKAVAEELAMEKKGEREAPRSRTLELEIYRRDGSTVWVEAKTTLLRDSGGRPVGILGVSRDISERKQAEEALRESEAKFRGLAETAAAAIFITQGPKYRYVNPGAEKLTGYRQEELLDIDFWDVVHPDHQALVRERGLARQRGEEVPSRYEFRIVTKSGEERWVDMTAGAIEFEGESSVIGTAYDITERKRAEEALRESEERFRAIVENAPFGYYRVGKDGLWQYVNPVWERMHGYSLKDVIGKPFEITQPREDVEKARQLVKQALAGETLTGEFSRTTRLGTIEYHSFNIQPVRQGNETVAIEGFINDITERKRAEEALRETYQTLQALVQASPLAIITVDLQGNVETWNPAAERIFGWSEQEALGRPNPIIPEDRQNEFRANLDAVLRGNPFSKAETRRRRKDGSLLDVSLTTAAMRSATGDIIGVMGIIADITEQKRAEEALQKAREELEARVERQMEKGNSYGLSFRELTVLHLVAAGQADKEIASHLGISPLTAHKHLGNILAKMDAASRTEAGVRALREGLLD